MPNDTVFKGVLPAACTQFRPDESLDIDTTLAHLDAMIDAGVHGMVMLGTVGENYALTPNEKL
ncbi:MAG: dihydrodipicolinate synthase family protein, partial [Planctomycetota bacterium]